MYRLRSTVKPRHSRKVRSSRSVCLRPPSPDRHAVVEAMIPYVEERLSRGAPLSSATRHMLGLFQGLPGARAWRRHLSENAHLPGAGPDVLLKAASLVPRRQPVTVTEPAE